MEAKSLKKKNSMTKSKLKKTIKNIVCRPDPVHWPLLSEEKGKILFNLLSAHKIEIPKFVKPPWQQLKLIPKDKRPKPSKIEKVKGLFFGISECSVNILNEECSAVIIESKVNPRTIVNPTIENCINHKIPVICLEGLRKFSASNYGIPTSCLGIQKGCHNDIVEIVLDYFKEISKLKEKCVPKQDGKFISKQAEKDICSSAEEIQETPRNIVAPMETDSSNPYLFRTNKKARVFTPPCDRKMPVTNKEFSGQDFITFSNKVDKETERKKFMKMIVKRMSNNENRKKTNKDQGKL